MPELSLEAAHEFWKEYPDPSIYRVIAFLESVEDWSLDGDPDLEEKINQIGSHLDELKTFEGAQEQAFIGLCAHIKSSRILRLLQAIDSIEPGSASKMLMYSEENNHDENPLAKLFLQRNIAFERLRLMGRVFSPERLNFVMHLLEKD